MARRLVHRTRKVAIWKSRLNTVNGLNLAPVIRQWALVWLNLLSCQYPWAYLRLSPIKGQLTHKHPPARWFYICEMSTFLGWALQARNHISMICFKFLFKVTAFIFSDTASFDTAPRDSRAYHHLALNIECLCSSKTMYRQAETTNQPPVDTSSKHFI